MMKQRAIEILNATIPQGEGRVGERYRQGAEDFLKALAAANAFQDEETAADRLPNGTHERAAAYLEIDRLAGEIYKCEVRGLGALDSVRVWAVKLATACRKAGLVKP